MTSAAAFLLVGMFLMVAGATALFGLAAGMIVAGGFCVAVGVDLARSPRTPAPGTDFTTANEARR